MNQINSCKPVVNKLVSKLSIWKVKMLSIGGRLTLLKSVLGSLAINYVLVFRALV